MEFQTAEMEHPFPKEWVASGVSTDTVGVRETIKVSIHGELIDWTANGARLLKI